MNSAHEKLALCFVIIGMFFHIITGKNCVTRILILMNALNQSNISLAQTTESEVSLIYDGTEFTFFQISPDINQADAQTQCINWAGNLDRINSAVEDSLLLYSIPDLETTFTCYIGLNDINNEAGTDGDAFVWIDGSDSTYRMWGTLNTYHPRSDDDFDCVRYRYRVHGILSQGWISHQCTDERNCYFCNKPGKERS